MKKFIIGKVSIHKRIIAFLIISLLLSCETSREKFTPPSFEESGNLKCEIIQDFLLFSYPFNMVSFGNYVVILAFAERTGTWLQVYDKQTGEHIGGYVRSGQGPGEIVVAGDLDYNKNEHTLTIFELDTQQSFIYKINEGLEDLIKFESKKNFLSNGSNRIKNIFKVDEKHYLIDSRDVSSRNYTSKNNRRFSLVTETGDSIISVYNDYATSKEIDYYAYIMQAMFSISPDRGKMVCTTLYGAVLETFEINNSINLIQKKLFYPIILEPHRQGGMQPSKDTIWGFVDICTSDKYIYTVLIGNKDNNKYNNISVFNWNGDPISRFETDMNILRVCYNETDNSIYAIAVTEYGEFNLVKIKPYME